QKSCSEEFLRRVPQKSSSEEFLRRVPQKSSSEEFLRRVPQNVKKPRKIGQIPDNSPIFPPQKIVHTSILPTRYLYTTVQGPIALI
ncbi:MAG: hypothetical protein KGO82_03915, partial [Bacteroidota bacterium]|nr:hypothetical protein [Bacteroidota bacterium]